MRPVVLTIGGFDPSAGAGVLADIKTFEQHQVYGLAVNTANTVQNEDEFESVNWLNEDLIYEQLEVLQRRYVIVGVKFGLVPSFNFISKVLDNWKAQKPIVVWDPILSISAGYDLKHEISVAKNLYSKINVITPNREEMCQLANSSNAEISALLTSELTTVYLKGGHLLSSNKLGTDIVYSNGKLEISIEPTTSEISSKHGSGCILSASLLANLAKGMNIKDAATTTKYYIDQRLSSNRSLLAYHN